MGHRTHLLLGVSLPLAHRIILPALHFPQKWGKNIEQHFPAYCWLIASTANVLWNPSQSVYALSRTHWVNTCPPPALSTSLGLSRYVKRLCSIQGSVSAWQRWWEMNAILKLQTALRGWRLMGLSKKAELADTVRLSPIFLGQRPGAASSTIWLILTSSISISHG